MVERNQLVNKVGVRSNHYHILNDTHYLSISLHRGKSSGSVAGVQVLPYFCLVMKRFALVIYLLQAFSVLLAVKPTAYRVDDIITDIYHTLSETESLDYDDLYEQLIIYTQNPINLNNTSHEQLAALRFLSDKQIDDILLYVHEHPMDSLYELQLINSLADYEIRNLLPFVCLNKVKNDNLYWREVFRYAKHDLSLRVDGRYLEDPLRNKQHDPVYSKFRYRFNYQNRVMAGLTLQRSTGSSLQDLLYGGYIRLNNFNHLHTLVAGHYQASFGQGLVTASPFRLGHGAYVLNAASAPEGIKQYTSLTTQGLQGIGTTLRFNPIDISAWYSINKDNDTLRHHVLGTNLTYRHRQFTLQLTAIENLYSDSVAYYYENAKYNRNYFRGNRQFVAGVAFKYNYRWAQLFGELATAQNLSRWGIGTIIGAQLSPWQDIGFLLLYRYYSPHFDNTQGYAFSETSRINDENGGYVGVDIKRLKSWRFSLYGDLFRFEHIKYGIPYAPSWGYDVAAETTYLPSDTWHTSLKIRSKKKGDSYAHSLRYRFVWNNANWHLLSEVDAMYAVNFAYSITQDIHYHFSSLPLSLQLRLQGFRALNWNDRIYIYENDVLYAFTSQTLYGLGGRAYLNFRYQILPQLSLYLRFSETLYADRWAKQQKIKPTRTDIHLLLRATL